MKKTCLIAICLCLCFSAALAEKLGRNPDAYGTIILGHKIRAITFPARTNLFQSGKTVDSLWFTSNGADTQSSTQGEILTWACSCLSNDTIAWEIWLDNGNGLFDSTDADHLLHAFNGFNGDTVGNRGLPDTTAVADSEMVLRLKNGFAPALYWFRATSLVDGSGAVDSLRVVPLASPWATVSGHVHVPQGGGDSTLQANLWLEANPDNDSREPVFWAAITDSFGNYAINLDSALADSVWKVGSLRDIIRGDTIFLAPADTSFTIDAGAHPGVDFSYIAPSDSVTGTVVDDLGNPVTLTTYVSAWQEGKERYVKVEGTHYRLFFSVSDTGSWRLSCGWEGAQQSYLSPMERYIEPLGAGHLTENFTIYRATDSITGRLTEQGGAPANTYRIYAYSDLFGSASALSDIGTGRYRLMVCDTGSFNVAVYDEDKTYPIPDGWVVSPSGYSSVTPSDTGINFDLGPATEFITGIVTRDTGDSVPLDFSQASVGASVNYGPGNWVTPDSTGFYSIPVSPDTFLVRFYAERYLAKPGERRNIAVAANDTVDSMNFTANYGHCRVNVLLRGWPTGDSANMHAFGGEGWPDGYASGISLVDSGPHDIYICNATGWWVGAPMVDGYRVDSNSIHLGDITHADTFRSVVFNYTQLSEYISGSITQDSGDIQAFDPEKSQVYGWRSDGNTFAGTPDSLGQYLLGVAADTYNVGINWDRANGWFWFKPYQHFNVVVQPSDTAGPYGFTANFGHCRVSILLRGYPSGDTNNVNLGDSLNWMGGYTSSKEVSDSGPYNVYICNSNGWWASAPSINGYILDSSVIHLGSISHSDTLRQVVFTYNPSSEYIEGQITQDAGDSLPVDFNNTQVFAGYADDPGTGFGAAPDGGGFFRIGVVSDSFNIGVRYYDNGSPFLFKPYYQNQYVAPLDTLRGIDFTANQAHCVVEVNMIGYPADSIRQLAALDSAGYPGGYMSYIQVSSAGLCTLHICNSNGWYVIPPNLTDWNVNPAYHLIGDITHSDYYRGIYSFTYSYTGVEGEAKDRLTPKAFSLSQNNPNPATGSTGINYQLPRAARVTLAIYNILGQEVRRMELGEQQPGYYSVNWDGRDASGNRVSAGVYLYRLQAGGDYAIRKMTMIR
jgi:hypothetical protein